MKPYPVPARLPQSLRLPRNDGIFPLQSPVWKRITHETIRVYLCSSVDKIRALQLCRCPKITSRSCLPCRPSSAFQQEFHNAAMRPLLRLEYEQHCCAISVSYYWTTPMRRRHPCPAGYQPHDVRQCSQWEDPLPSSSGSLPAVFRLLSPG
jgi:hypothetical protein